MKNKHMSKLIDRIILVKVSACPHVATRFQDQLIGVPYEVLERPAFNPDLLPGDFHVIGLLNKALKFIFSHWMTVWLRQLPKEFLQMGYIGNASLGLLSSCLW
jgi:hypothetical protein